MKEIKYQKQAVEELVNKTIKLLNLTGYRKKIVFKAPTGAGKTVVASETLDRLVSELPGRTDNRVKDVAFIWIAPNKLHVQSYMKMKNFFSETHALQPKMYDEIDHSIDGSIRMGEILFVNWESIRQDNNVMVRDSETGASLYDIVRRTKEQGRNIVVVIDEEHMFTGANATRANTVLNRINPKVEIRISATPITNTQDEMVSIPTENVVEAGMIKQKVILNPKLNVNAGDAGLNEMLMREALQKRAEIAEAYKRLGVDINPLLLIQLPNDKSDKMSADENVLADRIKQYLNLSHGINADNNRLAVWLSGEKENLAGIENRNSVVDVLLFKQAIALGWDCPRAAVLLIFRKIESQEFGVQTVGRIMRMPEQHFYTEGILNNGYVYTNLSKDMIRIYAEDMNYISHAITAKRRNDIENVLLTSTYIQKPIKDANRLGPKFKTYLDDAFREMWGSGQESTPEFRPFGDEDENDLIDAVYEADMPEYGVSVVRNREMAQKAGIDFNVTEITIELPEDIAISAPEAGTYKLKGAKNAKFARTKNELKLVFSDFCRKQLKDYEQATCTPVLSNYVLEYVSKNYGMTESDAIKVILCAANKDKFERVFVRALENYKNYLEENRSKTIEENFAAYSWELPEARDYDDENNAIKLAPHHALQPYVREKGASNQEILFEAFLEKNGANIEWWYKNGDKGRQHFAVPYTKTNGQKALFYVDYIIRMNNGDVWLFDTKTMNSDPEAPNKHNALIDYMNAPENKDKHLKGSVIIENNGAWWYSPTKIAGTDDLTDWTIFNP